MITRSDLLFYSIPWDGTTIGVVHLRGRTYELRDNGLGRYRATEISDEEMAQHGANMLEISEDAANLDIDEVIESLERAIPYNDGDMKVVFQRTAQVRQGCHEFESITGTLPMYFVPGVDSDKIYSDWIDRGWKIYTCYKWLNGRFEFDNHRYDMWEKQGMIYDHSFTVDWRRKPVIEDVK